MTSATKVPLASTLLLAAIVSVAPAAEPPKVAFKLPPDMHVQFFEPEAVRLLDGPFREAMLRDQAYLLSLPLDRILHTFRLQAKLPTTAEPLGGWESPNIEIRGELAGHYLTACSLMYASTGDARFKERVDLLVPELARCQQALGTSGYLSAFPESHFDRIENGQRAWAPWYVIHKILSGLLDGWRHCGNAQSLEVARKLGDWAATRTERLSDQRMQAMLGIEHGGMTEALANLYAATGDEKYLRAAQRFVHQAIVDPLAKGEDRLDGLHANTQIPKLVGSARLYQLTADPRHRAAAEFFWQTVSQRRSYVIGGHSDHEHFSSVDSFARHLSPETAETCNTYNMLRLTRELFSWSPSVQRMDFYERGLFNHILASKDPRSDGGFVYFMSLKPGHFKTYSTPMDSFWCCVCTGMENHAKYTDTIYAHGDDALYVNLFLASALTWKEKGLVVRQETRFPEQDWTRLTFHCSRPLRMAVQVRFPAWAGRLAASVNGQPHEVSAQPGMYAKIDRLWRDGDTLDVRLPMELHTEPLPGAPDMVAVMFGPVVLAGELGAEGMPSPYARRQTDQVHVPSPRVPVLVADSADWLKQLEPIADRPLSFRTRGLAKPADVTLVPFYQLHHQRYSVYWKVMPSQAWPDYDEQAKAKEAAQRELDRYTTDRVFPGQQQSDQDHELKGLRLGISAMTEHKCRFAADGGWLSYVVAVHPQQPMRLICTYWGDDGGRRQFDILVDDKTIATESLQKAHPGEFFDVVYPIPAEATQGKTKVTVRFQAKPGNTAGGVFGLRMAGSETTAAPQPKAASPTGPVQRPNFLVVLIDDMGCADLSCCGNTAIKTENIDRLAAEGIRFTRFYVSSPICSPSRTGMTTGQYPARWRINSYLAARRENIQRGIAQWLDPKAPTLARHLQQAGYTTGHFGKWHMGGQRDVGDAPLITEYGFDASLTQFEGLGDRILPLLESYDGKPPRKDALGSDQLGRGEITWLQRRLMTRAFTDRAIAFIKEAEKAGKPFYVNLWPTDVHSPFRPPAELRGDQSKKSLYLGVLKNMDWALAPIFDYIRQSPTLRDRTLILLTSDNGPEPGAGSAGELRGHKGNLYEGGIREPLIVWGPGFIPSAQVGSVNDKTVVTAVDVAPSLLRLAGVKPSKGVQFDGDDLSPSLLGKTQQVRTVPVMWKRPPDRPGPSESPWPDLAVREGDWKLLVQSDGGRPQLYDLIKDPGETKNLADQQPDLVRRLSKLVLDWNAGLPK